MSNVIDQIVKGALSIFLISLSLLIASMMITDAEKKEYAYVNFDGGYSALGYIAGIQYVMDVSMKNDEGQVFASGKEEVLEVLRGVGEGTPINEGVFLEFDNSYLYSGSVQTFTMKINSDKTYSDGTVMPQSWISNVIETERLEKDGYKQKALSYVFFESAPGGENPLAFLKNLFN